MQKLDITDLWLPMRGGVTEAKKELWLRSRSLAFHGFPVWPLPDAQTWQEDPYSNNTWKLWYHCLTWLYVPAAIFDSTGDTKQLDEVRSYTLAWMVTHAPAFMSDDPSDMAWDDHAIAYRSTFLVYLYRNYFMVDSEWGDAFRESISFHAQALHGFLWRPEFFGNNHGVFHCLALLSVAAGVPELEFPDAYRADAEKRLFELLGEMIDTCEGVTREQASEYQFIALELVYEVIKHSRLFCSDDASRLVSELRGLMTRLVDFAFAMRWPDGSVPAIGDTWLYWNGWSRPVWEILEGYVAYGFGSESTKKAIRQLREGLDVNHGSPEVFLYRRNGYLMVTGGQLGWAVFMKAGPSIHSHGHHDHLSVQLFMDGELLLVDSGGPYKYSDPQREYFIHPRAHNTIVCRGQSGFYSAVAEDDINAVVTDVVSQLGGRHAPTEGVTHSRNAVFLHECRTLIVCDEITTTTVEGEYDVEQFWHFPPGMSIQRLSADSDGPLGSRIDFLMTGKKGISYCVRMLSSGPIEVRLVEGQIEPRLQGWVTCKVGTMSPAPVLEVSLKTTSKGSATTVLAIWANDGSDRCMKMSTSAEIGTAGFRLIHQSTEWDIMLDSHRLIRAVQSSKRCE